MGKNTEYLLKYVTNDTYQKLLKKCPKYLLQSLADQRVDVDLNIRYLIRYGVTKIDVIVLERLDDLLLGHNDFIDKISSFEKRLTKYEVISMLENG